MLRFIWRAPDGPVARRLVSLRSSHPERAQTFGSTRQVPMSTDSTPRYTLVAILLHWAMAALVVALFAVGWSMVDLPKGPARGESFALHKSLGLTAFLLLIWRLSWRLRHRPPALPSALPRWQQRLAHAVHHSFYLLLVWQPLTGYLSSSFSGYDTKFFGLALPRWGHENLPVNQFFTDLHVAGSVILLVLIGAHLLGTLVHLREPGTRMLRRMLPW